MTCKNGSQATGESNFYEDGINKWGKTMKQIQRVLRGKGVQENRFYAVQAFYAADSFAKMELMMKKRNMLHDKITSTRWIILRSTLIIYIRIFQGQDQRSTRLM